jgi:hypothetical protein
MRVIYLQGPHGSGKTTRARELWAEDPDRTIVVGWLGVVETPKYRQEVKGYQGVSCSDEDLIVVVDPDTEVAPTFTVEIENLGEVSSE